MVWKRTNGKKESSNDHFLGFLFCFLHETVLYCEEVMDDRLSFTWSRKSLTDLTLTLLWSTGIPYQLFGRGLLMLISMWHIKNDCTFNVSKWSSLSSRWVKSHDISIPISNSERYRVTKKKMVPLMGILNEWGENFFLSPLPSFSH